jgi:hypothetical protein
VTAGVSASHHDIGSMILGTVGAPATTPTSADGCFNLVRAANATLQAEQDIEASSSFGAIIIVGDSASLTSAEVVSRSGRSMPIATSLWSRRPISPRDAHRIVRRY